MGRIKRLLKRTPAYYWIRARPYRRLHREWTSGDEQMRRFYAQFLRSGALCFDVGANFGNRVKVFLRLDARIVAVEPQDECVQVLRRIYRADPRVTLVAKALGESPGAATMRIARAATLSSLSVEWIEAVSRSGRFASERWPVARTVPVTTLDDLIAEFGVPAFVKIDVEGSEAAVVRGLSRPVGALSFEFTPELLDPALAALDHLARIGQVGFNYSLGETMIFALRDWVNAGEMTQALSGLRGQSTIYGDVYARFV